ncbi:hypothetical protein BU23DRAFT_554254 [Bimuria novae-zelandiae CBS 107.79]|uniref:Uncharacterized protein n=1 Tax=Bimuria novae-zelandiae CBS 107.79 TaxID=1447943 RepID=A0A6A5V836_9PLEO|nr:hypothetical protein BU23DRAFT_554254 [Bimuria novae-zelandiae CBS 107.79]
MSRGEDVNGQGRDSTPSASMVSADTSNSRTLNNTPHDNAEGDRRDYRAEASNIASYDQPTPTNLNNHLRDWSADESPLLEEAIRSQNNEPSACMSEFWTYSRNGFDNFHTNSSEPPVLTVTENPALLGAPQTNHFNPQADDSSNLGVFNVTPFGNNTPATHTVTNGSVPNHNRQDGRNISDSTLREERPTRLGDFLPQADPATQEQWQDAWTAALSGHASDPVRRPETPLPTGNVENGNARAQDSLGDVASVDGSGLQLGTPTNGMLAVLETFSQYPEDETSSASGEDTTAGSQANLTNTTRRRRLIPLADNDPNSTRAANGRPDNHGHRALRYGGSLRRMTSEENRAFWREFSDSENDRGPT